MLKVELDNLIAPFVSTQEEFDAVEHMYMTSRTATHEDAAKIWKVMFKKDYALRQEEKFRPVTETEVKEVYEKFKCGFYESGIVTVRGWVLHISFVGGTMPRDDVRVKCHKITDKFNKIVWTDEWYCSINGINKLY